MGEITERDLDDKYERKNSNFSTKLIKIIKKRLPITKWIPTYGKTDLIADIIAGVTVGLTVVPQSMAYAAIAGLTPEFGLYSSYLGVFLYVIFGSCKQVTIGPTAVMGLLTYETCGPNFPECAILTGFYSGVFELFMAFLQLGWVVSFISEPVTVGFTAAAACTIASSQIKNLMGINGPKGSGFLGYWKNIIHDFTTINYADLIMGICCVIALLSLRKLKDVKTKKRKLKTALWLISVSRNVIIVITTSLLAYFWKLNAGIDPPFKLTGQVRGGFPKISLPPFELPKRYHNNSSFSFPNTIESNSTFDDDLSQTQTQTMSFFASWNYISSGPIVIALISILQNVAISKAFGSGQSIDCNQEMFALGLTNFFGGFLSAIPNSGSFSRSAVNDASGVKSPMGGLFTGILVLLSLGFVTPYFYYIPKSSLAAVIICAVIFMIEYQAMFLMWKISKLDVLSCILTFFCAIFLGMEYGILIGVAFSIAALLLKFLRPSIDITIRKTTKLNPPLEYLLIIPESGLNFPSVDHIRSTLNKNLNEDERQVFVLDCAKWTSFDYTAATALSSLVKGFEKNGKILVFVNCHPELTNVCHDLPQCPSMLEIDEYLSMHVGFLNAKSCSEVFVGSLGCNNNLSNKIEEESSVTPINYQSSSTNLEEFGIRGGGDSNNDEIIKRSITIRDAHDIALLPGHVTKKI